ncbi:MAG TPA: hypothetical protein VEJ87_03255 [Acidimicrobiales bacterium]|nr:hypothetical protein [Acidimicrobiales bacterium]
MRTVFTKSADRQGRGTDRRVVAHWLRLTLVSAALAGGLLTVASAPASAGTPTNINWALTNNQVGATGVTYSYSFTTATTGIIKTITYTVSGAGLGGTPAIGHSYGIGAGSVAIAGQTITYTVTNAVSVSAGIPIYIEFTGMTNSSTAGSYTTTITTKTAAAATIDTGTTPAINLAANNTAVTVSVGKSLTFTINNTAYELDMDPSLPVLADQSFTVGLTVLTNAHSGYTLVVNDNATGLQSSASGGPVIPKVSTGKATAVAWPGAPNWGYTVTGTGATIDPDFSGGKYAGYTSAGEEIASRSGATGATADTITITNQVAIDYSVAAGIYTDTLTYTVTPNYT